jgi:RNA polymerase sigma factor (TIGR02999 family)
MKTMGTKRADRFAGGARQTDAQAAEDLFALVYEELKDLARHHLLQERKDHTLQATALVHEAYLRLRQGKDPQWAGRTHFFNAAAQAMSRILVEHARARGGLKRGGKLKRIPLEALDLARDDRFPELVAIDDAVACLEKFAPSVGAVVRLRFYAGLNQRETAEALGISERTVRREWTYGRAWLALELRNSADIEPHP